MSSAARGSSGGRPLVGAAGVTVCVCTATDAMTADEPGGSPASGAHAVMVCARNVVFSASAAKRATILERADCDDAGAEAPRIGESVDGSRSDAADGTVTPSSVMSTPVAADSERDLRREFSAASAGAERKVESSPLQPTRVKLTKVVG